jgi:hypothetical protein
MVSGDDGAGALLSPVCNIAMWCISIISICKGIYGQGLQEYISGVLLELREFGGREGLDKNSGGLRRDCSAEARLHPKAGSRSANCRALLDWTGEGTCPYMVRGGPQIKIPTRLR